MTLDEAWAAAEAALPDGWVMGGVMPVYVGNDVQAWKAYALGTPGPKYGSGPTPIAALISLAEVLVQRTGKP